MTLGAYYQWNPNEVIHSGPDGLGETPDSGYGFAEENAQQMLREANVAPIGIYTQWAKQEGDVVWVDQGAPQAAMLLYPANDALLRKTETDSFGHPVAWVAVLTKSPVAPSRAEAAFNGTRYGFTEAFGVYRDDDPNEIPHIQFLYWAQVRDVMDPGGGAKSADEAARGIGGKLVLPVNVPRPVQARRHPAIGFKNAFDAQTSPGGTAAPLPGAGGGSIAVPSVAQPVVARAKKLPLWGWGVVGAVGYGVYRWFRG